MADGILMRPGSIYVTGLTKYALPVDWSRLAQS